ncbi:DUF1786 family protein [Deferribacter thermophilus]|uniref:DUF1786 family protein n=1 Tax=Deferribacter thermophilus TaxID=53573 RepID=UPI003C18B487
MVVLSIDIGLGTADYLLYEEGVNPENFIKLILPSPTKLFSKKISNFNGVLTVGGYTIGGGFINKSLKRYLSTNNVILSKDAAKTVSDDLSEVINEGFKVVEDIVNPDIFLKEIDLEIIDFIEKMCGSKIDKVLVAAQDHGFEKGKSDRVVRIEFLKKFLKDGLLKAKFEKTVVIPNSFSRWNSLKKQLLDIAIFDFAISDTSVVASLGAAFDAKSFPCVTVDVGNGHTFIALIDKGYKISAFIEHHTSMLSKEKILSYIADLCLYKIKHEDIFNDGGHGAHIYYKIDEIDIQDIPIYVTGPRRKELFDNYNERVNFVSPFGDVMITGNVGLLMQQSLV